MRRRIKKCYIGLGVGRGVWVRVSQSSVLGCQEGDAGVEKADEFHLTMLS